MIDENTLLMGIHTFLWWNYLHAPLPWGVLAKAMDPGKISEDKLVPGEALDDS